MKVTPPARESAAHGSFLAGWGLWLRGKSGATDSLRTSGSIYVKPICQSSK